MPTSRGVLTFPLIKELYRVSQMTRSTSMIAALVLCAAPLRAQRAEFTFTVPVRVSNLPPDSRQGAVYCTLLTGAAGTRGSGGTAGVGGGSGSFTLTSGAFDGEVTVEANTNPGNDPATVTHYSCAIAFYATLRGRDQQFAYWMAAPPGPVLPVAPGPQSPRIDGAIR